MAIAMRTDEVIDLIKQGSSIDDIVISDIEEKKLNFRDAILLVEHGFLIPKGNIVYSDSDIEYDPEFDEVNWQENYGDLSDLLKSEDLLEKDTDTITIELTVEDKAVKEWLEQNTSKLKEIVNKLVVDLYHTDQRLHSK